MSTLRFLPILTLAATLALPAVAQEREERRETAGHLYARALLLESGEGKTDEAMRLYRRILETYPDNHVFAARATYRLALCHRRKGEREKAAELLRRAAKEFKGQREVHELARRALERLEHREEAREDREDPGFLRKLGELAKKLEQAGVPRELIERRLELERELRELRGRMKESWKQIERGLKDSPAEQREKVMRTAKQQIERAMHQMEKRLNGNRRLSELFQKLDKLHRDGDKDALRALKDKLSRARTELERAAGRWAERQEEATEQLRELLGHLRDEQQRRELGRKLEAWASRLRKLEVPQRWIDARIELEKRYQHTRRMLGHRFEQLKETFEEQDEAWQKRYEEAVKVWQQLRKTMERRAAELDQLFKLYELKRSARERGQQMQLALEDKIAATRKRLAETQVELRRVQDRLRGRLDDLLRRLSPRGHDEGEEGEGRRERGADIEKLHRMLRETRETVEQLKKELRELKRQLGKKHRRGKQEDY